MPKPATIRDVAREAGVSVAVVSRVMNDGTGPVASDTRARVVDAIGRLNYQPRAAARELQQQSSTTIGLVLADLTNPFFARLADRVVWEARSRGLHVVLLTTQEDPSLEADSIETLIGRSVGAVIATPTGDNLQGWRRIRDLGVHVVFVDRQIDALQADTVAISNYNSVRSATEHMIDLGHRRIGFISGPLSTSTGRDRLAGFRLTMQGAGLDINEQLIHPVPFRGDAGGDAVTSLLNLESPPTGLIVGNTAQVRPVLRQIQQSRIAIPDQLSLIVFDDNPWTELVTPPLTAIRQPIDLLALHSVDVAAARLRGSMTDTPRRIQVDGELIRRSSTGPVDAGASPDTSTRTEDP